MIIHAGAKLGKHLQAVGQTKFDQV
jgi:hypothetical protein